MHYKMLQHPNYCLKCSKIPDSNSSTSTAAVGVGVGAGKCSARGAPFMTSGDSHFNPPEAGMLVFDDSKASVRDFWLSECYTAVSRYTRPPLPLIAALV